MCDENARALQRASSGERVPVAVAVAEVEEGVEEVVVVEEAAAAD